MSFQDKPVFISQAFATNGEKEDIPETTTAEARADYDVGFPPITRQAYEAGGKPPHGTDFNGLFYKGGSVFDIYAQAGGTFPLNTDILSSGGYTKNAVVIQDDGAYRSLIDNNTDNFITTPSVLGTSWIKEGADDATETTKGVAFLPKQITISNGSDSQHDIDFGDGNFSFDDGTGQASATALTKQADATWSAGDNVGGMAQGVTLSADTPYYIFALSSPTGDVVDFGFDDDKHATNLLADSSVIASGLTKYKRLHSFLTDGSANILNGTWVKNRFYYNTEIEDVSESIVTTAVTRTLSVPVVNGILALINGYTRITGTPVSATFHHVRVFNPNATDSAVEDQNSSFTAVRQGTSYSSVGHSAFEVLTNDLGQVKVRGSSNDSNSTIISTRGWIDTNL